MLYMTTTDGKLRIIVLETGNLEELRKGRRAKTPDGSVLIAWTPDPAWLAERIMESGGDGEKVAKAIEEAAKRPQQKQMPPFPMVEKVLRPKDMT